MEWRIDLSQIRGLRKWYDIQPGKVRVATGRMLNNFAFGVRLAAIEHIGEVMTVRNPRFVASRVRAIKANTSLPINSQVSYTGSLAKERFSGWVEQELGKPTDRKRFGTLAGRGGVKTKQLRHVVRLKPANEVIDIRDYNPVGSGGGKNHQNIGGFFAMLKRRGEQNKLVKIGSMLMKKKRDKWEMVQSLRKQQPKRIPWLQQSRAIYFRKTNLDELWIKTLEPLMGKPRKS